jgi:hypothetical protein
VVIAHAYDELSADRSDRRGWARLRAGAEFERGASTQSDAAVVAAFLAGAHPVRPGSRLGARGREAPTPYATARIAIWDSRGQLLGG